MTILDLDQAKAFAQMCRKNGRPITLCHGTFDLLHPGHLDHLRQAKEMGGPLVVSITSDAHVAKGPGRPLFNQDERATMLSALWMVDVVVINDAPNAVPIIVALIPSHYVKGPDYARYYTGPREQRHLPDYTPEAPADLIAEIKAVEDCGGVLVFTRDRGTMSSTKLIARLKAG